MTAWFIMSTLWVFDGRPAGDCPNLYRLLVLLLTFGCVGCATPLILCAAFCCSVSCFLRVLGFEEEDWDDRGASEDVIDALPIHKFTIDECEREFKEVFHNTHCRYEANITCAGDSGLSSSDTVCCICLGNYADGVDLRELPCSHKFHMGCVDRWLKISAICPLCKHEITLPKPCGDEADELLRCF